MSIFNKGFYIQEFYLAIKKRIQVGKLGSFLFEKGYYYYVGSAQNNVYQRVERHTKIDKPLRWHIDYLSVNTKPISTIIILSQKKIECHIARILQSELNLLQPIQQFGSSDCNCYSHLFFSKERIEFKTFEQLIPFQPLLAYSHYNQSTR